MKHLDLFLYLEISAKRINYCVGGQKLKIFLFSNAGIEITKPKVRITLTYFIPSHLCTGCMPCIDFHHAKSLQIYVCCGEKDGYISHIDDYLRIECRLLLSAKSVEQITSCTKNFK